MLTMPAHRIGKGTIEQIVVFRGQFFDDLGQILLLVFGEVGNALVFVARNQQRLEGPCGPIWHDDQPIGILDDDALLARQLLLHIVVQECASVFLVIFEQVLLFD